MRHSDHILESERFFLREFIPDDANYLFELNNDPLVLQYTGDKAFNSLKEAKDFISNYREYEKNGFGRWAVIDKINSEFLGWCGLKLNEEELVDLGFRFFKKHWNRGIATEASFTVLDYAFNKLHLDQIIGRAQKLNHASIRVLNKIGMGYWKTVKQASNEEIVYYRIKANG